MPDDRVKDAGAAPLPKLVRTLPARWYWDPEIYEAERQLIFAKDWQFIGALDRLAEPGDYIAAEIAGWKVLVIRARDGRLNAFHNMCSHRAAPVVENGAGHCDILRCVYHGWVYDTDGRLRVAPYFGEAADFDKATLGLKPIKCETWRGLVFVTLDPQAGPLLPALGDMPEVLADTPIERYRFVREVSFDITCNWKTYTDNFVEGYHVPGIHPSFGKVIDFDRFTTVARDRLVVMQAPQKSGSIYGGVWLWQYPSMSLSTFPGGMNTSRIQPTAPDRGRLTYNFFFEDTSEEHHAAREKTIETNCQIVREDFGICTGVQENLRSGAFGTGPLSPRHEAGVAYYHGLVRQALGDVAG